MFAGNPHGENTETESEDNEIFVGFDGDREAVVLKECKVIVGDVIGNESTANKNVSEHWHKKIWQVENCLKNERKENERNHEKKSLKEEIDDIKERILNELSVVQDTSLKGRKTLTKMNVNKKLKNKIK